MIKEALRDLGFGEKDIAVYFQLLQIRKGTANYLSKKTSISRTTVYSILEKLSKRDLVYLEKSHNTTYYVASHPEALMGMVVSDEKILQKKRKAIHFLIPELKSFFHKNNTPIPKITVFEGEGSILNMLKSNEKIWKESVQDGDITLWGYQDTSFIVNYSSWLQDHWQGLLPNEKIKLITNEQDTHLLPSVIPNREVFILPPSLNISFTSSVWVVGEYVILLMTQDNPHYVVQMRDAHFAQNLQSLFQLIWTIRGYI